ncbi:MAG: helix-turn-helix domain-containing protein [Acetobacteraceae bacterium]|nr:helix-turn-helix domain-containing protein [Acetobacteraceae bacterium]
MAVSVAALRLSREERRALEELARHPRTPSIARRARILLLAADGVPDSEIAVSLGTTRATVAQWRHRFAAEGLAGVTAIRPGRGRKPRIAEGELREMITAALETAPPAGGAWTCRSLARLLGVSPATVSRVWRAPGAETAGPGGAPAAAGPAGAGEAFVGGGLRTARGCGRRGNPGPRRRREPGDRGGLERSAR